MFKWEKYAKSTHSQKELKLTFKKRLFVGPQRIPENQVEFDLVFHQALDDVRNDRYPLLPEESPFVVALRAQVEYGNYDASQAASVHYPALIDKYLPKHLRTISTDDIAAHHIKLRDLGKQVSYRPRGFHSDNSCWDRFLSLVCLFVCSSPYTICRSAICA